MTWGVERLRMIHVHKWQGITAGSNWATSLFVFCRADKRYNARVSLELLGRSTGMIHLWCTICVLGNRFFVLKSTYPLPDHYPKLQRWGDDCRLYFHFLTLPRLLLFCSCKWLLKYWFRIELVCDRGIYQFYTYLHNFWFEYSNCIVYGLNLVVLLSRLMHKDDRFLRCNASNVDVSLLPNSNNDCLQS